MKEVTPTDIEQGVITGAHIAQGASWEYRATVTAPNHITQQVHASTREQARAIAQRIADQWNAQRPRGSTRLDVQVTIERRLVSDWEPA